MNEQIKELAEQAGFYVANGKIYIPSTSEEITTCQKKFAELIVKECVKLLPPEMTHGPDGRPLEQVFKQHFGVEQ